MAGKNKAAAVVAAVAEVASFFVPLFVLGSQNVKRH